MSARPSIGRALDLLGRHVGRCSDGSAHGFEALAGGRVRDPEVGDDDAPSRVEHHVVRLEVAVNDPLRVRGDEAGADVRSNVGGSLRSELAVAGEQRR
jgi:hypothetical protein